MQDQSILRHIRELVEQEQKLYAQNGLDDADHQLMERIQMELDQCWDLLRQRRAKAEFGEDPDKAEVRSEETVKRYLQ